jgi:hypothetical protein
MVSFIRPNDGYSRAQVRAAGQALATGHPAQRDEEIAQAWRDAHAYVLNTFQTTLRRWIRGREVVLVQRLKRLSTIRDKLETARATDLLTMHDLAGCRLIFRDADSLSAFRSEFHSGTRSAHEYTSHGKYDYITDPKVTGYRAVHDVFRYKVEGAPGNAWNGLRVEIQYRTAAQHAWATAVEISDLIDNQRVKFDRGTNVSRERLFVLASEYIARRQEGLLGPAPTVTDEDLVLEMHEHESELGVFARLRAISAKDVTIPNSRNLVLCFSDTLRIDAFRTARFAMEHRNALEISEPGLDVVYVRSDRPAEVAGAFRNYFRNAKEFIGMLPGSFL